MCLAETNTKYYVVPKEGKGQYRILTKLPNYKMLGGVLNSQYAALFAEKIEIDDSKPRSLRLLLYSLETEFIVFSLDLDIPEDLDNLDWSKMVALVDNENTSLPP